MNENDQKQLADQASRSATRYNNSIGNTMTPDQQYWYMEGYMSAKIEKD